MRLTHKDESMQSGHFTTTILEQGLYIEVDDNKTVSLITDLSQVYAGDRGICIALSEQTYSRLHDPEISALDTINGIVDF